MGSVDNRLQGHYANATHSLHVLPTMGQLQLLQDVQEATTACSPNRGASGGYRRARTDGGAQAEEVPRSLGEHGDGFKA